MTTKSYAGNTLAAFTPSGITVIEVTTASSYDSILVYNSIKVPNGSGNFFQTNVFANQTTMHARGEFYSTTVNLGSSRAHLEVSNSSGTVLFRVRSNGGGSLWQCEYWNGSTYTAGSTFSPPDYTTRGRFDLHIVGGASGSWTLQWNSVQIDSGSITSASCTNFAQTIYRNCNNADVFWSQCMGADYDASAARYQSTNLNGDSATNTGGTGAYTTINETPTDDTTYVAVATSGNKQGQTKTSMTVAAGYTIKSVFVNARGRVSGTITDGKVGLRSGGTNYSSAGLGFGASFGPKSNQWATDPATSAAWTQTGYNNAEVYEEAA